MRHVCAKIILSALGACFGVAVFVAAMLVVARVGLSPLERLLLAITCGLLASGVMLVIALCRATIMPLRALSDGAAAIARGDLNYRLAVTGSDELSAVAEAFNLMAARLHQTYDRVVEEQQKVLLALEASQDGIWISDSRRRIIVVNSALERLTGHTRDRLLGQSCCALLGVRAHDGSHICHAACPFHQPERTTAKVEGLLRTAADTDIWVEISYGQITDKHNHPIGVMHVVHDLTRYKELEQLKDELLATVSHELRTPLNHIKGFASTLLQPDVAWDSATQHDFLTSIDHEADRLALLVEKLLDLSRLESGRYPLQRVWCSVHDLVDGALAHTSAIRSGRAIRLSLPAHMAPLYIDDDQIKRVLVNLIENGVKYSNAGSPLSISVAYDDHNIIFTVLDQGIGISNDDQQHIFERFYRVGARAVAGAGLGLAICWRIVEIHHGHMVVASIPGVGSRFGFHLPLDPAHAQVAHSQCAICARLADVSHGLKSYEEANESATCVDCR